MRRRVQHAVGESYDWLRVTVVVDILALMVAASGLWFSVRLVAVSTVCAVISFSVLLVLRHESSSQPHYPVIFAAALVVIGGIVAYQVHRVRSLSRYFEQTQLPTKK